MDGPRADNGRGDDAPRHANSAVNRFAGELREGRAKPFTAGLGSAGADLLAAGTPIGDVVSLRDRIRVTAAHGGQVVEWLVEDGDLVSPGQPLLRLHPNGSDQ